MDGYISLCNLVLFARCVLQVSCESPVVNLLAYSL